MKSEHILRRDYTVLVVSKIEIERASDRVKIIVYTAKPGVVIGKGGAEIEKVKGELSTVYR